MTLEEIQAAFGKYKGTGRRLTETSDPVVLAGGYLAWANNDLKLAIETLRTHDGRYVDRPDFSGRADALRLLELI